MKTLILTALVFFATALSAQEIEPVSVYNTKLYCYKPQDLFAISFSFGEKPLFTGYAAVDSILPSQQNTTLEGPMMFLVNQDTGTWILGMMSPTGEFCSIAVGADFEPYSE